MKANNSDNESVTEVMQRVSHADLLSYYFGIHALPVLINSPLRRDEKPSFYIYSPDGVKVFYKDYATGDRGDIYTLLQRQNNVTFSQLIRKIASEKAFFHVEKVKPDAVLPHIKRGIKRSPADLKVKIREWRDYDTAYWESFGITLPWLRFAEVYPVSHKIVYKDGQRYVFRAAKYAYVFVERKDNKVSLKVYQPMSSTYKWSNSNNASVVGLWTKMPEIGDNLCVCSSLKDALCLWANADIPAIYVQSETTGMSSTAQEVLRKRFRHIYVCFDNDPPGLKDGIHFSKMTGFQNIILPPFKGGKDISDLYRAVGKDEFLRIIKPLFNGKQESQERHTL